MLFRSAVTGGGTAGEQAERSGFGQVAQGSSAEGGPGQVVPAAYGGAAAVGERAFGSGPLYPVDASPFPRQPRHSPRIAHSCSAPSTFCHQDSLIIPLLFSDTDAGFWFHSSTREFSFEWDKDKEASNLAKHGVSFWEAVAAFADPRRVVVPDLAHIVGDDVRSL